VPVYRDEAVVLRTHKLGEADRIVTLLTRAHGKVRAVAKGVRRTSSKFGARLEPFMVADVQLYEGRSLDIVNQAESLGAYGATIAADYAGFTAANAMVETADRLTESEGSPQQYLLLIGALRSLSRHQHDPSLTLDSYLLRAFSLAGWAPSFDACARCGRAGRFDTVVVQLGGVVCPSCAPTGAAKVGHDVIDLLSALLAGRWDDAESAEASTASKASGIVAAYAQWHLERGLRSLPYVSRDVGKNVGRDAGAGTGPDHSRAISTAPSGAA
jgi:DNA repair protein RecO (recombination protein O)